MEEPHVYKFRVIEENGYEGKAYFGEEDDEEEVFTLSSGTINRSINLARRLNMLVSAL